MSLPTEIYQMLSHFELSAFIHVLWLFNWSKFRTPFITCDKFRICIIGYTCTCVYTLQMHQSVISNYCQLSVSQVDSVTSINVLQ